MELEDDKYKNMMKILVNKNSWYANKIWSLEKDDKINDDKNEKKVNRKWCW